MTINKLNTRLAEKKAAAFKIISAAAATKRELTVVEANTTSRLHAECAELQVEIAAIGESVNSSARPRVCETGCESPAPMLSDDLRQAAEIIKAVVDNLSLGMTEVQRAAALERWEAICVARGWALFPELPES